MFPMASPSFFILSLFMSSFIIIIFLQAVVCLNKTYVFDFCIEDCVIPMDGITSLCHLRNECVTSPGHIGGLKPL